MGTPHRRVAFAFGTINLNHGRGKRAQHDDLDTAIGKAMDQLRTDTIVLAVQEASGPLDVRGFTTIQPRRRNNTFAGEAILVSERLRVRSSVAPMAIDGRVSTQKDPIRDRFHPMAVVETPLGLIRIVSNHDAPRDYAKAIRIRSRQQLADLTRGQQKWLAGGDFNDRRPKSDFGVGQHLAGARIDLLYGSSFMASHAGRRHIVRFPERHDDHPAVFRSFRTAA